MTWLDLGNGWRNLFLLSCLVQAFALGAFAATRRQWLKQHRVAAFLTGTAVTPLAQYLWMLLVALVWPAAPKLLMIGLPPVLAAGYIACLLLRHRRRLLPLLRRGIAKLRQLRLDRAAIVSVCFVLAMGALLLPVVIRSSTNTIAAQGDSGEYLGLALRWVETRDTQGLFEKDDVQTDYRGHSHFPSLELYLSYGLLHAGDTYGYPYDKPAFTAVGLLFFYLLAAFVALCLRVIRGRVRWLMLALLLLNLIPYFVFSFGGATRDAWRCLAVLIAALLFFDLRPGKGWRILYTVLAAFAIGFVTMSAHVVCFVIVPFIVAAWVVAVTLEAAANRERPWLTLVKSTGAALGAAAGVLLGFIGNLWCYIQWGEFSPWRVMTTYTTAPWYDTYLRLDYRLEETTTHLNFWQARYDIVMAHATPVGIWGMRLAVLALLFGVVWVIRKRRQTGLPRQRADVSFLTAALFTLFTLAPMTGLLDTSFYSFSGTFIKLQRYTLQWYLFACVLLAGFGALAEEHWGSVLHWVQRRLRRPSLPAWMKKIPALLCALLCLCWFAEGTKVTGDSASFFRYGRPWLTDPRYAQDTYMQAQYGTLLDFNTLLSDEQNILISRIPYQYPLHSRALLLTANPVAPILNLTLAEIPAALAAQSIAAVVTEPGFWDDRLFAETTLDGYLRTLPPAQIVETETIRIYIIDAALAEAYHAAFD